MRAVTVALALAHVLSACVFVGQRLPENGLEERLQTQMSAIVVNETSRSAAIGILGPPDLESQFWRLSLHRLSEKDTAWRLYAGVPGWATAKADGYVLLTYDAQGRVAAMDARTTYGVTGMTLPEERSEYLSVSLRAGPFAVQVSS